MIYGSKTKIKKSSHIKFKVHNIFTTM